MCFLDTVTDGCHGNGPHNLSSAHLSSIAARLLAQNQAAAMTTQSSQRPLLLGGIQRAYWVGGSFVAFWQLSRQRCLSLLLG